MERLATAALAALVLSPILLQGLWCPLAVTLRAPHGGLPLTGASLVVAAAAAAGHARGLTRQKTTLGTAAAASALGVAVGRGDGGSTVAAVLGLVGVAIFASTLVPWMVARLPTDLDGLARRKKLVAALVMVVSLGAVAQSARLSTFVGDPSRTELSLIPSIPFIVRHSCLTAYVQGARLAARGDENLYDADNWPDLRRSPRALAAQEEYAPFSLDAFAYPPPFLLLPRALLLPLADFRSQRAVWFAFNALVLALGLWAVAAWVGGSGHVRAVLLLPAVWVSLPTLLTLQVGNVHATILALAMLAMVAFECERPALGGALLAFAVCAKLSPGLLVILLLLRRRFREVAWTAAFAGVLVVLGVAVLGLAPFKAFVLYQMPRLGTGEALSFLANEEGFAINLSPFGLPFKLAHLGVDVGDVWATARAVNGPFSVVIVLLTALAARRHDGRRVQAMIWLTVLTLGTLRSPFAPGYVLVPLLWMFSLWAAEIRGAGGVAALAAGWVLLGHTPPLPVTQLVVVTLAQQVLLVVVLVYLLSRRGPIDEVTQPDGASAPAPTPAPESLPRIA